MELVDSDYRPMPSPQFYNPGSEIALGCVVRSRENWSTEVAWFKDGRPIDLSHRPTVRYVNLYISAFRGNRMTRLLHKQTLTRIGE